MNRFFSAVKWVVVYLFALAGLNLLFFGFVVGLDVLFGAGPQFTVPLFVPLVVCGGTLFWLVKSRSRLAPVDLGAGQVTESSRGAGARVGSARRPTLHSALVIRRRPTPNFNTRERRSYEASV